ncbi:MAG: hypothetical protein DRN49_05720 [Thaumarchaeota archaeon]|nr:MAG: hypothetical protein DRN49_05720 [Nitrososphaerota archaeon]
MVNKVVDIEKALDISGAGSILMQPVIDKVVAQLVDYRNPLRQNLPRKPGSGSAWVLNRRTACSTTPAAWVLDTDELHEDEGNYTQVSFYYKTLAARGKVTRKLQAVGRTYADILADELESKVLEFKDVEDKGLLIGSTTASATSKEMQGLKWLIPESQTVVCYAGTAGGTLTLELLDEAIDLCTGEPDMLIMSKKTRRLLNALLQSSQRFIDKIEVKGGFKVMSYNNIPIYTSNNVVNTQSVGAGGTVSSEVGGSTSSIYVVDTEHTWVGVLTPVKVQPLAKTSSQFDKFDIFCDEVLVVRNYQANSKLVGIAA